MEKRTYIGWLIFALVFITPVQFIVAQSNPPRHSSSNFGLEQYGFGAGGETDANSASFNSRSFVGDIGIGNSSSSGYQVYAGYVTTEVPSLEFEVDATSIDFGVLDSSTMGTGVATFRIRNYLSEGYVVKNASAGLEMNGEFIDNLTSPTAAGVGSEQFGINLVDNTTPNIGANPVQAPDEPGNPFSFGIAETDYNAADVFKYANGDVIASSPQSTGQTNYTISYVVNVADLTPGGIYTMDHVIVATSTY